MVSGEKPKASNKWVRLPPLLPTRAARQQVPWPDFERLLREKADASALTEINSTCATSAALERVELALARSVGMEEVLDLCSFVCSFPSFATVWCLVQ